MKYLRLFVLLGLSLAMSVTTSASASASPGTTDRASVDSDGNEANGASYEPAISGDGRYVAFASGATNLVLGDTNGAADIFVHDRHTGITERVSIDSDGNESSGDPWWACNAFILVEGFPSVSTNARYVVFPSRATELVPNDTNGVGDIFVHDRGSVPVGGIAELPDVPGSSGPNYALAGLVAAAVAALTAGAWYARRRLS